MTSTTSLARRAGLMLILTAGCASTAVRVQSNAPPPPALGVVFVAGGAGGYLTAPAALSTAVADTGTPLEVLRFDWSHPRGLGLSDQVDVAYSRAQGRRLAEEITLYRLNHPGLPVYVVGFSAGCAVALAASEALPPDSLERIVLLAPAVSTGYDVRPALASARSGLDVFTSQRDLFWLGFGSAIVGNADGRREPPAGRVGFRAPPLSPADAPLAGRLHQHPWDPCVAWTGNEGGHNGALQQKFLRGYVLPLLTPAAPPPSPEPIR